MNYYELFELPVKPMVDKTGISKKYFELQKKFHPDFFTNETEEEKENALNQSAAINKGFTIFSNKEKTLEYFLQLKGIILTDEKYNLPPAFLMEMMELNEGFDDETDIGVKVATYEQDLLLDVKPILSEENTATLTENDFQNLKAYYYKKKYLKRILERLDD